MTLQRYEWHGLTTMLVADSGEWCKHADAMAYAEQKESEAFQRARTEYTAKNLKIDELRKLVETDPRCPELWLARLRDYAARCSSREEWVPYSDALFAGIALIESQSAELADTQSALQLVLEDMISLTTLQPKPDGTYGHVGICSASRHAPAGGPGCICNRPLKKANKELAALRTANAKLKKMLVVAVQRDLVDPQEQMDEAIAERTVTGD